MDVREALVALDSLLVSPSWWTKGNYGRLPDGSEVSEFKDIPNCACWCLLGGVSKVSGRLPVSDFSIEVQKHMEKVLKSDLRFWRANGSTYRTAAEFNDAVSVDFAKVKDFIGACIAAC